MWGAFLGLVNLAQAGPPDPTEESGAPSPSKATAGHPGGEEKGRRWGGLLIPLVGVTTTDGFGLGFGGEVFRRPAGKESGYDLKLTPTIYFNARLDYTNDWFRVEHVGRSYLIATVGYQLWSNLSFAGIGGREVALDRGDVELGNRLVSPYFFVGLSAPLYGTWSYFGQVSVRAARVRPQEGSLLDLQRPFGVEGGGYADASLGIERRDVDRWPVPHQGTHVEIGGRVGGTVYPGGVAPLAGVQVEGMIWRRLVGERLVGSGRVLVEKSTGQRPFFEQDKAAGRWRDELGSEQALSGYGRTRTRGDGVVAALTELRLKLGYAEKGWFDLEANLAPYAEIGWLYQKNDPGPPLPTVGVGVPLLWQKAIQLRPFLAWGWRHDDLDDPRRPSLQFGLSVLDAL
jgi:hypothetical protein